MSTSNMSNIQDCVSFLKRAISELFTRSGPPGSILCRFLMADLERVFNSNYKIQHKVRPREWLLEENQGIMRVSTTSDSVVTTRRVELLTSNRSTVIEKPYMYRRALVCSTEPIWCTKYDQCFSSCIYLYISFFFFVYSSWIHDKEDFYALVIASLKFGYRDFSSDFSIW